MKVLHIGISSVMLISLVGCSSTGSDRRIDYGAGAKQISSLEVPPDLTSPVIDDRYKLPEGETVATFSDYSKGGATQGRTVSTVLPEMQGIRIEREGLQRWLTVTDSPERAWAVVRSFLLELGLSIQSEDQAAAVIETEWAGNRGKIPQKNPRSVVGLQVGKDKLAGERDKYLVRLERSRRGAGTEIHLSHRGMVEVYSENMSTSRWHVSESDPELEAIMLQLLMVRFGVSETQAASAVASTGTGATAAGVTASSVADPVGTATLKEVPGSGLVIVMNDAFDRSWRKVGLAVESAGLALEDKNRDKGIYYLAPIKVNSGWSDSVKFWKNNVDTESRYRVNVKDGGTLCEVSVTDQNGASNMITKQMTEAIYKYINQ